jgi:glutamate racemase
LFLLLSFRQLMKEVHQGESWGIVRSEDPIGVFDSGIGGLTVVSAIQKALPNETIYYFGDTARCPYGDKTPEQVIQFSLEICDFLVGKGVKMIVIACNTATSAALPVLMKRYNVPVIGVIGPGARAAVHSGNCQRIGVIGTVVTIASKAYEKEIHRLSSETEVFSSACPKFVPLVEQGRFTGDIVQGVVRDSLSSLQSVGIDTLILGCTHYPLLKSTIQKVMGNEVTLISSATETALEMKSRLEETHMARSPLANAKPVHRYFTTGSPEKMYMALREWLHVSDSQLSVEMVSLDLTDNAGE